MKLVFPNGEHGQVLLSPGINRVGSAADAAVVLSGPGIAEKHCEINLQGSALNLVPLPGAETTVNGRQARELIALRAGDQLAFGGVQARLIAVEQAQGRAAEEVEDEDPGATRIRQAIPKYVLRAVSGPLLGKVFPLSGPTVIGRADDCGIAVPDEGVSRRHVKLKPLPDGVAVEDLDSANGTYVANRKVREGVLRPGDELRLDSIRFLLVVPGQEIGKPSPAPGRPAADEAAGKGRMLAIGAVVVVVLAAVAYVLIGR